MTILQAPIFVGVVALLAALAIMFWPAKTASLLLLVAPIIWAFGASDIHAREPGATNIVMAVSAVATLMYARFLLMRQNNFAMVRLQRAALLYCITVLPSAFFSVSLKTGIGGSLRLISPVVFLFAVFRCSRPWNVRTFQFKALALSTVCMLAVIVAAKFTGDDTFFLGGFERLRAFALSPQHISLYSVAMVGVLVCGILCGKRRYLYIGGIVALLVCTYLTGFRTAWIGMAVLIGLVVAIAVRSGIAKFIATLIALSLLGASGLIFQSLMRYAHADEAMSVDMLNAITSGRIVTDSIAFDRYLRGDVTEWLFGIGGVYSSSEATLEGGGSGDPVHSDFLATLIECGVLGLVGYLFLLVTIGRTLLRAMRSLPHQYPARVFAAVGFATFAAFTVMAIAGAIYTNVFVGWCYYGFIGIILAQVQGSRLAYPGREATEFQITAAAAKLEGRVAGMSA